MNLLNNIFNLLKLKLYEMSITDDWFQTPLLICELHMTDKKQ